MRHAAGKTIILLPVFVLLQACPVVTGPVNITSSSAKAAYVVSNDVLRGMPKAQVPAFVQDNYDRIALPARPKLAEGASYYIVPVCNGTPRWEAAGNYVIPRKGRIDISCAAG
jgi:hypothetical protein